jgi:hypothetical protein
MNTKLFTFLTTVLIGLIISSATANADNTPVSGHWDHGGLKSINNTPPVPPVFSINNGELLIQFYETMPLVVTIKDDSNFTVYQETVYGVESSAYSISLNLPEGTYIIQAANPRCGMFNGYFYTE